MPEILQTNCLYFQVRNLRLLRIQQSEWMRQNPNLLSLHPVSQKKQQPGLSAVEAAGKP